MSDFSTYTQGLIANWLVGSNDMPSAPANVYVALHAGSPGEDGSSNEVSASSYSRIETQAATDWDVNGGQFSNNTDLSFPQAQEDWGEVTHFSLWDGSTATDNCLGVSPLDASRQVSQGDNPLFRQGNLSGQVD